MMYRYMHYICPLIILLNLEKNEALLSCGHLMFDELKLKNGIAYNVNTNEITGFVEEGFNTKDMFNMIFVFNGKYNSKKEESNTNIYVNQWRFRSLRGKVHNGDFFYNCGSLDGNEVMCQLTIVLWAYQSLGIDIFGLCSDSGGGNRKFIRILQDHGDVLEIQDNMDITSFINPINNKKRIYVWACSTHCVKPIRNNLYKSQKQLARSFLIKGNIP